MKIETICTNIFENTNENKLNKLEHKYEHINIKQHQQTTQRNRTRKLKNRNNATLKLKNESLQTTSLKSFYFQGMEFPTPLNNA